MKYEKLVRQLSEKIKKNCREIGGNLREFSATTDGNYNFSSKEFIPISHIFSWIESFFTGMAYWSYRFDKDDEILKWLYSYYEQYRSKVFDTPLETMHDLGFLYSPYAVAMYKLTGDPKMKELGIKAADELAKRFNPKGGYIRAWGRIDDQVPDYVSEDLRDNVFFAAGKGRAIIDCMMNIPLLFWASEETGIPYYKRIASCYADTVMKYIVRDDNSVCHAYIFDPETGEALREAYSCGYGIGSHWARGTAWAVYGFAIAYAYTKDKKYLDVSVSLLEKFIDECGDELPVWDFRIPESAEQAVDTSAVAIVLCAINEISKHTQNQKILNFETKFAEKILDYIDLDMDKNGILKECNGKHTYTSFGDYFITEYFATKVLNAERIW